MNKLVRMPKSENRRSLTEDEKRVAERVKRVWLSKKKELGMNQEDAASLVGWSQGNFNSYLNSARPITFATLIKFSDLLDVPVEELGPEIVKDAIQPSRRLSEDLISDLPLKTQMLIKQGIRLMSVLPEAEVEYIIKMIQHRIELMQDPEDQASLLVPEGDPVMGKTSLLNDEDLDQKAG